MNDTTTNPDHSKLFGIASEQAGYFTTAQAHDAGFSSPLIRHHVRTGRFTHVARGLYRLRDYPSTPREEVLAAWLRLAPKAVVSHESALDILGLSDVIPDAIHMTVPRTFRKVTSLPGVTVHTTIRPVRRSDIVNRDGVRLTNAARTIADVAEAGMAPDQVERAVRSAIERGFATRRQLRTAASSRGRRVQGLVDSAIGQPR
jgi:predicted transcriptional regulator of viral defense system